MLVLKRKIGQSVVLHEKSSGDTIKITLIKRDSGAGGVTISLDAPLKYNILRDELLLTPSSADAEVDLVDSERDF